MKRVIFALIAGMTLAGSPATADILIGVAGPMTGSNAAFGEQFRRGAEKAVADLNGKGGVLGQRLRLVIGDDACDPKQAVSAANDLASGIIVPARRFLRPTFMRNPESSRSRRPRRPPN